MARVFERPKQTAKFHYSDPASTREYAVTQAATRDEAASAVGATAPLIDTVDGVDRFFSTMEIKEAGGGCWDAIVNYARNPESVEMNIDVGAGSTKALQSLETIAGYSCLDPALIFGTDYPDFGQGIGYNGTHFDGVDVELPKMEISINKKLKFSTLDPNYLKTLFDMAQTVNDDDFTFVWKGQNFSFAAGTLRFRGARIKQDADDNLDICYSFAYSKNLTAADNRTFGGSEPIEKLGHEYLWIYYEETTTASQIIKTPIAVYVEKVYEPSDFTALLL